MPRLFILDSEPQGKLDQQALGFFIDQPGLLTLNDADTGRLGVQPLGGLGAGFVVGLSTSVGSPTGAQGFVGSAAGSQSSAGNATGSPGLAGTVVATSTSTGSATGIEGAQGVVVGANASTGSATGTPAVSGNVTGFSVNGGAAGGTPDLLGTVTGSSTSSGLATGTVPTPPAPTPTPTTKAGGRRYYVQPPKQQPTFAAGSTAGTSRSQGLAQGRCGHNGRTVGASTSVGICRGTSRLSVSPIRLHIDYDSLRRKAEDELLLLEIT